MTSKFLSVLESYKMEQGGEELAGPEGRGVTFKYDPPMIHCAFRISWHLVKVGKGVYRTTARLASFRDREGCEWPWTTTLQVTGLGFLTGHHRAKV